MRLPRNLGLLNEEKCRIRPQRRGINDSLSKLIPMIRRKTMRAVFSQLSLGWIENDFPRPQALNLWLMSHPGGGKRTSLKLLINCEETIEPASRAFEE